MFTYACLRDTHSPSSQHLTHKENNMCLENKDTITHNHSQTLSFWLDDRTHTVHALMHVACIRACTVDACGDLMGTFNT